VMRAFAPVAPNIIQQCCGKLTRQRECRQRIHRCVSQHKQVLRHGARQVRAHRAAARLRDSGGGPRGNRRRQELRQARLRVLAHSARGGVCLEAGAAHAAVVQLKPVPATCVVQKPGAASASSQRRRQLLPHHSGPAQGQYAQVRESRARAVAYACARGAMRAPKYASGRHTS
jgi:hypothetical protein